MSHRAAFAQDGTVVLVARPLVEPPERLGGPELVQGKGGIVSLLVGRIAVNPLPEEDAQQWGLTIESVKTSLT